MTKKKVDTMKQTRILMGMPITVEIVDSQVNEEIFTKIYAYFSGIDQRFSTYKKDSEISLINQGKITQKNYSPEMKKIFRLCQKTKKDTQGYFDIYHQGKYDPSGLVKGWAILNAANLISQAGYSNYYVEAGGDIQVCGKNQKGQKWKVGIKNPFSEREIVKILELNTQGVATSGNYIRGDHIYNPQKKSQKEENSLASLTVVGPNVYEADRFATSAFAMGKKGIVFIEKTPGLAGYAIDKNSTATYTSGLEKYVAKIN